MSRDNGGRFARGNIPWTKGRVGIRLSPATQFHAGQAAHNRLPVGSLTIRTEKSGNRRAWVKLADPNKWQPLAQVVWEIHVGPIPRGCVVHHVNRDTLDDRFSNLSLETRSDHMRHHKRDLAEAAIVAIDHPKAKQAKLL